MPRQDKSKSLDALRLTADELSGITGLTDRRHRQIAKEGYFPQPLRGSYALRETIAGLLRWHRDQINKRTGTLTEEKQRKLTAERKLIELHLRRENRKVLDAVDVKRAWEFVCMTIRQRFIGLPAKVAPRLPFCKSVNEMESALDTEVREILNELSRPVKFQSTSHDAESDEQD